MFNKNLSKSTGIIINLSVQQFILSFMTELSNQEKMKFSHIMFQSPGREDYEIDQLNKQQVSKLRSYYAQKIAYDTINGHIQPPPQYAEQQKVVSRSGILGTICCCFYPEQHRDKFDVRTSLFLKRLGGSFVIIKSNFLSIGEGRIQLYGPLWLTIAYIIILALSANLNEYFIRPTNYKFNQIFLMRALGIVAIFKIAEPFVYAGIVKCLGGSIKNIQSAMLTGYSVSLYLIPTFLCLLPSLYWHVAMLCLAGFLRAIFIFRNYSSKLQTKKIVMLGVALIMEAFYCFVVLKTMFNRDSGYTFSEGSRQVFHNGMMLRQFQN